MKNLLGHPVSYWTVCKIDSHQKMFKNRWNNSFAESGSACIIDLGWICIPIPNAEFLGIFQSSKKKGLTQGIERIQIQLLLFSNHVFCYSIVIQITSGRFSMHFSNRNLLCHVSQPQPKMVELQNTFSDALYSFCHPYTTVVDDVENCLARKTYLKVKSIVTRETWERKTIEAIRSRKLFYAFLLSEPCTKRSIFPPIITQCITVFENHRKSLIQHCERSELRLHFEWTKVL